MGKKYCASYKVQRYMARHMAWICPHRLQNDILSSIGSNVIPSFHENAAKGKLHCRIATLGIYVAIANPPSKEAIALWMSSTIAL